MSKIFVADKLKIRGNKILSTIALILILTVSAFMTSMPTAYAADIPIYAFLTTAPEGVVGVGQPVHLTMWLDMVPPTALGALGDRWHGFTVAVTKPDGTTQTLGPFDADPVASAYTSYIPDVVGTYVFQFNFPGQNLADVGNYYEPSSSPKVTLTVQQQPIQLYPENPLPGPNQYWQRPISSENRLWGSISGNWLEAGYSSTGAFAPYTTAPSTAHIVWTKEITFGGLVGGELGDKDYYPGMSYENKWSPPIIMQGRLYYNSPDPPRNGFYSVDLRTGQTLWFHNGTSSVSGTTVSAGGFGGYGGPQLTMGQLYDYESPNQHGVLPYLWGIFGNTWSMYDPTTGDWIMDLVNASVNVVGLYAGGVFGPNIVYSPSGDMLVYALGDNWLAMWNSSSIPGLLGGTTSTFVWMWRPIAGTKLDWRDGIQWNVTIPNVPGQTVAATSPDVIVAYSTLSPGPPANYVHVAYSTADGHRMWIQNRTGYKGLGAFFSGFGPIGDGVYTVFDQSAMAWYGYDVNTGNQIWGPTEPYTNSWGFYMWGLGNPSVIAYGRLYSAGLDGMVHCYDVKTGQHLWDYYTGSSGFETPYGHWPFSGGITIADGKVYACTADHSPDIPLFRGGGLYCIDAQTGKLLWKKSGWFNGAGLGSGVCPGPVIADGYLVALNVADGQIYAFGKGQTATTVSTPDTAIPLGTQVLIKGTVTDQSSGQTGLGIPAKGTPAISDADMSQWMEYLYNQQPVPDHASGVPVTLTAVDSNHNTINIGTTTSDNAGLFHIAWTPPATGEYTIIASFGGSNSYFASSAENGLAVVSSSISFFVGSARPLHNNRNDRNHNRNRHSSCSA